MSEIECGTLEAWSSSVKSTEGCRILPPDCRNLRPSALAPTSALLLFFFSTLSLAPADEALAASLDGEPAAHLSL